MAAEETARRRDAEEQASSAAQRQKDWNARQIETMGYQLMENTSVSGASFARSRAASVTECAVECVRERCDAFAYQATTQNLPTCYRYKAPITLLKYPNRMVGKRIEQPPAASADAADIVRCPTGPVKVTGFTMACEAALSGGSPLGATPLTYRVADVNECASKCRPDTRCMGFAFNAADTANKRNCEIYGPTPIKRPSRGWVSGLR